MNQIAHVEQPFVAHGTLAIPNFGPGVYYFYLYCPYSPHFQVYMTRLPIVRIYKDGSYYGFINARETRLGGRVAYRFTLGVESGKKDAEVASHRFVLYVLRCEEFSIDQGISADDDRSYTISENTLRCIQVGTRLWSVAKWSPPLTYERASPSRCAVM